MVYNKENTYTNLNDLITKIKLDCNGQEKEKESD